MASLVNRLQEDLENHWDSLANGGPSYADDVVYSSCELLDAGVGGVVLTDQSGVERWWDCEKTGWRKRLAG